MKYLIINYFIWTEQRNDLIRFLEKGFNRVEYYGWGKVRRAEIATNIHVLEYQIPIRVF